MRHIDLFSGIGGFALAADRVFGTIEHTFVENDPFCQVVLKKHWPNSQIHGDIRQFIADTERKGRARQGDNTKGQYGQRNRTSKDQDPFLLTGGFPCQPFSQAGRRKGTADDRYLWPEMFRVIQLYQPTWVIAENVRGFVTWNEGMVLETTCADLESESYEVQPFIIPACAVQAPHRRDRVWIVAKHGRRFTNPDNRQGRPISCSEPIQKKKLERRANDRASWQRDWREVALATCHDGVDDGLPRQMDGFTISGARHRKERLKACGNAIVPQIAEEIMKTFVSPLR